MIALKPGRATLADWRAVADGAGVRLDPAALPAVEASARTVDAIVARGEPVYGINTGFGKLASVHIGSNDLITLQRNIVLSHAAGVGEPMRPANVRLMMALKLASLGHGASGVRPHTLAMLEAMLERDIVPVIPSQGSVGTSGDLAPLAHLAAVMLGIGEARVAGETMPADAALDRAGLMPIVLGPKEGLALLNGTQFSTAEALASLFAIERVFHAALITGALATDAAKGSDTPFDARIHALRGHRGQIEVATALRALMAGSSIRASHLVDDDRVQDPYCVRCQPQVMGAVLDLARQATATLTTEANGVSDNPLIFADSGEALSGGNFHGEPVAFAADMLALATCEIGSLAERRVAMLDRPRAVRAAGVSHPAARSQFRIDAGAGDGGGAGVREQAARLSRKRGFDPDLRQSGGPRFDVGAWRAPARGHGRERGERDRDRAHCRRAGMRLPRPAQIEHAARAGADAAARARAEARSRPLPRSRHRGGGRSRALRRARRRGRHGPPGHRRTECMTEPWLTLKQGDAPLLVSFPHTGMSIPAECAAALVSFPLARHDADRHIDKLYAFATELRATTVHTALSRTVIDVNRDPSGASLYPGQTTTGLVPTETFDGRPLYRAGQEPTPDEIERRKALYFAPYHLALAEEIKRLRAMHPRVVLYDCHSIRSREPRLFLGELPVFNIGTNAGKSCEPALETAVARTCAASPWSHVVNGRFTGGWITRTYGRPAEGVHAVQMELAMRGYLPSENDPPPWDPDFAKPIQQTLRTVLEDCLAFARG